MDERVAEKRKALNKVKKDFVIKIALAKKRNDEEEIMELEKQ